MMRLPLRAPFDEAHRGEQSLAATQRATELYQRLAEAHPATDLPGLARSLRNLGWAFTSVGRMDEFVAACEQAAGTYRSAGDLCQAAEVLTEFGRALLDMGLLDLPSVGTPPFLPEEATAALAEIDGLRR
ncbi:hypothetical protein ACFYSH_08025 [Streptomyces sp. NPDC005791]|uniref:hypothetical protein n=1 Tax=Streptomyces sp. NPDC005791 TaxID=3364732 RepID=UPI00367AEFE5